jgi:hypothetical protein
LAVALLYDISYEVLGAAGENSLLADFCRGWSQPFFQETINYAATQGVPWAQIVVPAAGLSSGPGPLSLDALIAHGLIPYPSEDDERAIA